MLLKADLIDILENLSFEVIHHDELGKLIKFSPEDAFLFSAIVGANYLIEPTGVTMKVGLKSLFTGLYFKWTIIYIRQVYLKETSMDF